MKGRVCRCARRGSAPAVCSVIRQVSCARTHSGGLRSYGASCARALLVRVFSLYNVMASGVDSSKSHSCLPFHSRLHSSLYRQSFSTVTDLSLSLITYHSDVEFLAFILSFIALERLFLAGIQCNIIQRAKDSGYILLLKNRKGVLEKLHCLFAVRWHVIRFHDRLRF